MKRLLLFALLVSGMASGQPAAPSPTTTDLARLLMQRDETLYGDVDGNRHIVRLREALLAAPGGCDVRVSECVAVADSVARRYADAFRSVERERAELLVAQFIAERMRDAEAARLLTLLRSADGDRLTGLLAALRDPRQMERRRREAARAGADINAPLAEARGVFRREIRNLPQAPPR